MANSTSNACASISFTFAIHHMAYAAATDMNKYSIFIVWAHNSYSTLPHTHILMPFFLSLHCEFSLLYFQFYCWCRSAFTNRQRLWHEVIQQHIEITIYILAATTTICLLVFVCSFACLLRFISIYSEWVMSTNYQLPTTDYQYTI